MLVTASRICKKIVTLVGQWLAPLTKFRLLPRRKPYIYYPGILLQTFCKTVFRILSGIIPSLPMRPQSPHMSLLEVLQGLSMPCSYGSILPVKQPVNAASGSLSAYANMGDELFQYSHRCRQVERMLPQPGIPGAGLAFHDAGLGQHPPQGGEKAGS